MNRTPSRNRRGSGLAARVTQPSPPPALNQGLPFRAFAERVGEAILPAVKAMREEQRRARVDGRAAAEAAEVETLAVPHLLPFTRW